MSLTTSSEVRRRPGGQAVTEREQFRRRQRARGRRGVDSRRIGFDKAQRLCGQARDVARGDSRQSQGSEIAVGPDEARAEHGGELAAARQPRQGELRKPVLAVDETEAEPGVAFALRGDVGDSVAVAAESRWAPRRRRRSASRRAAGARRAAPAMRRPRRAPRRSSRRGQGGAAGAPRSIRRCRTRRGGRRGRRRESGPARGSAGRRAPAS